MKIESVAITSDFIASEGCPHAALELISAAGFGHVHWCHHWCTDFVYDRAEIDQIAEWFDRYSLSLNDLHGSSGQEKMWGSPQPYQRQAGVALVKNRIDMAAALDCNVVIVHIPEGHGEDRPAFWRNWVPSLDELADYAGERGVRIAIENMPTCNFDVIEEAFERYDSDFLGLCYDAGHGTITGDGLDRLERVKDRLISLHLHDNDGSGDLHRIPFTGATDWDRLAKIIASSGYAKPTMTMESNMRNTPIADPAEFLATALDAGRRLIEMVNSHNEAASQELRPASS